VVREPVQAGTIVVSTAMPTRKSSAPPLDPIETRRLLLHEIAEAPAPVAAPELGRRPSLGRKVPGTLIGSLLADDVKSGSVFLWGDSKKPAYWARDAKAVARKRVLEIAAAEVLTPAALDKRAAGQTPKLKLSVVREARAELVEQKRLVEDPKTKRLIGAEQLERYLGIAIARLLEQFGLTRSPERIRALLAADTPPPVQAPAAAAAEESVTDVAEKMFEAMNQIAFAPGTTVTFYRLRQQPELANIPKNTFDRAALLLQSEGRALLSIHDHAAALPPEEQERFVTDGLGKFYVSIYAR
jgi:hypothetical protein